MANNKYITDYLIMDKGPKIAIALDQIKDFNFGRCIANFENNDLVLEPAGYSSRITIVIKDIGLNWIDKITDIGQIVIAEVKKNKQFGQIFEIKITNANEAK